MFWKLRQYIIRTEYEVVGPYFFRIKIIGYNKIAHRNYIIGFFNFSNIIFNKWLVNGTMSIANRNLIINKRISLELPKTSLEIMQLLFKNSLVIPSIIDSIPLESYINLNPSIYDN